MTEELVTLDRIRALAQCIIDNANDVVAEVGEAGASAELAEKSTCERILAAMGDTHGKHVEIPPVVVDALSRYAVSGLVPDQPLRAMLEGDMFSALAYAEYSQAAGDDMACVLGAFTAIAVHIREMLHPSVFGSPDVVSRWAGRMRA